MILLLVSIPQGISTYFAFELRKFVKPITIKFFHNISSVLCFVIGMVSLISGYRYGSTHDLFTTKEVEYLLIGIAVITTILSLIGAANSGLNSLKTFCQN